MLTDKEALRKAEGEYHMNGSPEFRAGFYAALEWLRSQSEPVTYAVLDSFQRVVHTDSHAGCHEHINDAINQFEIYEAAEWSVRPVYLAPQPVIPDGFVLVPKEPTPEMLNAAGPRPAEWNATPAGRMLREEGDKIRCEEWAQMIAAAPEPKSC